MFIAKKETTINKEAQCGQHKEVFMLQDMASTVNSFLQKV